jgi:hypothetical protein
MALSVPAQEIKLPPAAKVTVEFAKHVEPILKKRCQGCHGAAQQMNGLRLDDPEAALRGGYSGPAILPGKSAESTLIHRVSSTKKEAVMPPAGEKLSLAEIGVLRAWIDQGAVWPAAAKTNPATKPRSDHWAFQPIRKPELPDVRNRIWARNGIDRFIQARLESEGILPSEEAGRAVLLRRLSLDLTGLPPTAIEMKEWMADNRPNAYEAWVDRLLASPHYGEKWARHWLDLARYADSDGYEKDLVRPAAWRWRHWVIDALNRDMPFDQFTIEQIAGDLLPNANVDQRVATGFHRNTLTNREAGVDRAEARFEQVVNRANTVGTVWLGLTVGCAQCHDHKYDPITQKEYYQLFAFFNTAEEENIDAALPGEMGPYLRAKPEYDRKRQEILEQFGVPELQAQWEEKLREAVRKPGVDVEWDFRVTEVKAMVDSAVKILMLDPAKRSERQTRRLTDYFVRSPGLIITRNPEVAAKLKEARAKLEALEAEFPRVSEAPVLVEDPSYGPTHIAVRGDYRQPGIEVQPGTLGVLTPLKGDKVDRLALARWLVARENPLVARVTVNRIWQEFFGTGLVKTSEDFGTQGEKPSHPELLDWLASEFMDRGWSLKQLHRLIVTSAAYRQSSNARPELETRDPENRLLARQSRLRLSAEAVRDSALAASGLLNPEIGGRSVRPPQPAGIAELGYANSVKWVESKGPARYRRGLYIHFQRTTPYPQLMTFDAPDSTVACSRRRTSNSPLQALNLLNDPVFFEAAQALALRVIAEQPGEFNDRLDHMYRISLGRRPSASERERLRKLYEQQSALIEKDPAAAETIAPARPERVNAVEAAAWTGLSRVVLNLDEFITRE